MPDQLCGGRPPLNNAPDIPDNTSVKSDPTTVEDPAAPRTASVPRQAAQSIGGHADGSSGSGDNNRPDSSNIRGNTVTASTSIRHDGGNAVDAFADGNGGGGGVEAVAAPSASPPG
jgi:hypothetical protein